MHVAFFGTYGAWSPHFETELELAEDHLLAGDRVSWVLCGGAFDACEPNRRHRAAKCTICTWRVREGIRRLSGEVEESRLEHWLTAEDRARVEALPRRFATQDEIKAFTFDGFDAGWGALSSEIWLERDADINPASERIARLVRAGVKGHLAVQRFLAEHADITRVYLFNGRMGPMRGVLRAVTGIREGGRDVDCVVHERGQDTQHYGLFRNAMPHNIEFTVRECQRHWEDSDHGVEERRQVGISWFEGRAQGNQGSWVSFVDSQVANRLPDSWDPSAHNVVLFTTSEYEFAAVGNEYRSPLFESPHAATMETARHLSERGNARLTVRLHPNPDGAGSSSVMEALKLDLPGVTVVPPDSDVSTYDLMRAADVVLTSGSTAGLESTFWERPAVLAGRTIYSGTGVCHEPGSLDELLAMLEDPGLGVADREAAIRFGYYFATRGRPFHHFRPDGVFKGTFKGSPIGPTKLVKRVIRFKAALGMRP